jgi:thioesterase domain-containing protein
MARQLLDDGEEVAFLGLLDPARNRGNDLTDSQWSKLRGFRRAAALRSLILTRWSLYSEEMRQLEGIERFSYLALKLRTLVGLLKEPNRLRSTQRELNQIEVYRANLAALDHYQRRPLVGKLRALEIFHTARRGSRKEGDPFNWDTFWSGSTVQHRVPGKDSGDMLIGSNVKILAPLLAKRLSAAFLAPNNATDAQYASNYSLDTASR